MSQTITDQKSNYHLAEKIHLLQFAVGDEAADLSSTTAHTEPEEPEVPEEEEGTETASHSQDREKPKDPSPYNRTEGTCC